jgi:hypothetical protein
MTEQEWVACTDPKPMLEFLRGKASERKLRLFAVACCRRIWRLLRDERSQNAVEVVERFAEGLAANDELAVARVAANAAAHDAAARVSEADAIYSEDPSTASAYAAAEAAQSAIEAPLFILEAVPEVANAASSAASAIGCDAEAVAYAAGDDDPTADKAGEVARAAEGIAQARLLHDVIGNPFRPDTLDHAWRTPQVVALAQGIYNDRAFDRLSILADTLEEAGCDSADILAHLRGPGPHVRGCWAVDAILGKS